MINIVEKLLASSEPSIRFKTCVNVLSEESGSGRIRKLQDEIKSSSRVKLLLSESGKDGKIPFHPYCKWYGAHWVLASLADIGYPPGDKALIPLREQVYDWLLSKEHEGLAERHHPYTGSIKYVKGLPRIHASMEGNAVYSMLTLDILDDRTDKLAERLVKTQWPDGGWNCDKNSRATNSSFYESLIPLRALALHAKARRSSSSREAAARAAEIFLKRNLYKRQHDEKVMSDDFVKLHYPCYWHYDILFALKVMAEGGFIKDKRCQVALSLLESKRLPDGGFPAERKYYRVTNDMHAGRSLVDWGVANSKQMNEWVTVDALYVLKSAERKF